MRSFLAKAVRYKCMLLASSVVAVISGTPALASVVTYSHVTPTSTAPFTDTFGLPAFDLSLGTLSSIELVLSTSSNAQVEIFNSTPGSRTFTNATATTPITVTGPASISTSQNLTAGPIAGTAAVGFNVFPGLTANSTSSAFVPAADFSSFDAPSAGSNLPFEIAGGSGMFSGSSSSGVFFSGTASAGATTEIVYTYSPATVLAASEPSSLLVLGGSLAAFAVLRRRRS